jgi:hypothetical protein
MQYVTMKKSTKVFDKNQDEAYEDGKVSFDICAPQVESGSGWEDLVTLCKTEDDAEKFINKILAARSTSAGAAVVKAVKYDPDTDTLNAALITAREEALKVSKVFNIRTGTSAAALKSNVGDLETMAKEDPDAFAQLTPMEILARIKG